MRYALITLWFERRRYIAGVLAVAFSTLLMAMQVGIMDGLMAMVSLPIDSSTADVWLTAPNVPSCDLGQSIKGSWSDRLLSQAEVAAVDEYIQGFQFWKNPKGGSALVIIAGCTLGPHSLGPASLLTAEQRSLLTEPGAVIINEPDRGKLGIEGVGATAEVMGQRLRVVGFTHNIGSLTGPYVLCSLPTARQVLMIKENDTTYLLARCHSPEQTAPLLQALAQHDKISAYAADEFSSKSRWYWIRTTKAGIAIAFVAALGLCVGAVITGQTLYAATAASLRELMVLRALGIPVLRLNSFVMAQAFWVGVFGLAVGLPLCHGVGEMAAMVGTRPTLPLWLMAGTAVIALATAMGSGVFALRLLWGVEPAQLLR